MLFISNLKSFYSNYYKQLSFYGSILLFSGITASAVYFCNPHHPQPNSSKTVFMEDMTWQEIRQAIQSGASTVIIPTGGTEQNGPHVILGKHNYIVRYTAGKIAEQLGNTLVTPTIAYVPEGNITPPEGHMRFTGTLSIPVTTLQHCLKPPLAAFISMVLKQLLL